MQLRLIQLALVACFSVLLVHSTAAQIIPTPATPPPIIDPGTIVTAPTPTPTPPPIVTPTIPPISPPPIATPTIPPVSPPPVATPTIPPVSPPPVVTPTVPPVSPPPLITPTVPPIPTIPPAPTVPPLSSPPAIHPPSVLDRADPQAATAAIRYGPGFALTLTPFNNRGRFQKIAVKPGDVITVVLRLTSADFGKPADIQVLDGGGITGTPLPEPLSTITAIDFEIGTIETVSLGGQLLFSFRIGEDVGLHRVSVIVGGNQYFFQFWRQDMSAPNNNPGMLRAY